MTDQFQSNDGKRRRESQEMSWKQVVALGMFFTTVIVITWLVTR